MLKRTSLLLAALGMLLPVAVSALGLGEIRLNSALNEPLRAEIPLISVSADDADLLSIKLAPRDQYEKAGIEQVPELRQLRFETVTGADGKPAISVTTREAVGEPFLNFLIEVNWPTGRVIREYTVLLDPPVLMRGAPPVSQLPTVSEPAAARPPPVSAPSIMPPSGGEYGPVAAGETLWVIAETVRPDTSLTIPQVMLALQEANPDAFIRNNINLLKAGVVLRVPSQDEMAALAAEEAQASARAQAAEWDAYRGQAATQTTPAPRTETAVEGAPEAPAEEARLKLVVPEEQAEAEASTAPEGAGTVAGDGEMAELRRQLDLANEEAEARRLQNDELNDQIRDLEEQVIALEKLIELNVDELATLQENLKEREQADESMPAAAESAMQAETESAESTEAAAESTEATEAPDAADQAAEATETTEATEHGAAEGSEQAVAMPAEAAGQDEGAAKPEGEGEHGHAATAEAEHGHAAAEPTQQEPVAVAPPPPPPAPEPGLLEDPWLLGGAAVIVLALIGVIVAKRRAAGGEDDEEADDEVESLFSAVQAVDGTAGDATQAAASEPEAGPSFEPGEATGKDVLNEFAPAGLDGQKSGEDPLEQADVFLAYGRNDQAEEVLRNVLANEPGRIDVMVKLLEIYHGSQDRASFEHQLEDLHETLAGEPGPHWDRAVELAQAIAPDHRLVAGAEAAGMEEEVALDEALGDGELDIDLDFEPVFGDEADAADEPLDITQEFSGDGLSDLADEGAMDAALEAGAEAEGAAADTTDAEGGLDLDLGFEAEPSAPVEEGMGGIDLESGGEDLESTGELAGDDLPDLALDFDADATEAPAEAVSESPVEMPVEDGGGLDLDLGEETLSGGDLGLGDETLAGGDLDLGDETLAGGDLDLGDETLAGGDLDLGDETLAGGDLDLGDETLAGGDLDLGEAPAGDDLDLGDSLGGDDLGGFDAGADMVATKLELASTYLDMEDFDGARSILDEVLAEGSEAQQQQARELLERCPGS
jgi:pilus assembly protein FimV